MRDDLRNELAHRHMLALADMYEGWSLSQGMTPERSAEVLGWSEAMRRLAEEVGPDWDPPPPSPLTLIAFLGRWAAIADLIERPRPSEPEDVWVEHLKALRSIEKPTPEVTDAITLARDALRKIHIAQLNAGRKLDRERLVALLEKGAQDERASPETRAKAARHATLLKALYRVQAERAARADIPVADPNSDVPKP